MTDGKGVYELVEKGGKVTRTRRTYFGLVDK